MGHFYPQGFVLGSLNISSYLPVCPFDVYSFWRGNLGEIDLLDTWGWLGDMWKVGRFSSLLFPLVEKCKSSLSTIGLMMIIVRRNLKLYFICNYVFIVLRQGFILSRNISNSLCCWGLLRVPHRPDYTNLILCKIIFYQVLVLLNGISMFLIVESIWMSENFLILYRALQSKFLLKAFIALKNNLF